MKDRLLPTGLTESSTVLQLQDCRCLYAALVETKMSECVPEHEAQSPVKADGAIISAFLILNDHRLRQVCTVLMEMNASGEGKTQRFH